MNKQPNFYRLEDVTPRSPFAGGQARIIHSEDMTTAFWHFDAGSDLPMHSHHHEQITYVQSGRIRLTVGEETREIVAGEGVIIPGGVTHGGTVLEDTDVIDVFTPVREDLK